MTAPSAQHRSPPTQAWKAAIDRHFAGRGDPQGFALITDAMASDPAARRYFERAQLLAEIDPDATGAKDRLAAALGFRPEAAKKRASAWSWLPAVGVAAAAAAALLVVVMPGGESPEADDGFRARGSGRVSASLTAGVSVYRIAPGQEPTEVREKIRSSDELAFAYTNPDGHSHLMVWGVDEAGAVYWYHPAWTDPAANPRAVPARGGGEVHELKEAIAHDFSGKRVTLFALFTDAQPSVRDVEEALKSGRSPTSLSRQAADSESPGAAAKLLELGTLEVER